MSTKQGDIEQSPVAIAYQSSSREKASTFSGNAFKISLVVLDCAFLGMQPVLVHLSKNKQGSYSFDPVSVNFMTELAKTAFAVVTLLIFGTGRPGTPMYLSLRSFISDARHNYLLAVPAALYAVNNNIKFAMQLIFSPTTTKMLGNLKMLAIAVLMRLIMNRRFNIIQWEAVFLLVAGITINQLKNCPTGGSVEAEVPWLLAFLCTLGTVTVPSMASVYNEYALKKHMDTSVHLQNFFLYFYGACFNLAGLLCVSWWKQQTLVQMFRGQSVVTYMLIANNAAQGILASFFYKFADTILKKYSSTIATIVTAILSYFMFGHQLSINFVIGVSIVLISMHQFFTFGDKPASSVHKPLTPGGLEPSSSTGHAGMPGSSESENGRRQLIFSPSLEHITVASSSANGPLVGRSSYYIKQDAERSAKSETLQPLLPR
ncbi:hypothetical protein CEUSTIGMA_g11291.t1 [Chlamydomonas eustigma]|uniref:Nucleotide-sugar transporter n=1 Tax=Chlamydomonas eustigma TaxID=1157962 RepID=A0A250XLF0_9CHLO|nr:hypothetical protein CEUSTIGMA_g11291.t1 [Chlamydomonas eustigma]|eukprot:GAX83866.1 hypothetical protein CEUSTIGMA_g11291.t1 [Chlamydomonas eustigma]